MWHLWDGGGGEWWKELEAGHPETPSAWLQGLEQEISPLGTSVSVSGKWGDYSPCGLL